MANDARRLIAWAGLSTVGSMGSSPSLSHHHIQPIIVVR
jgi:hypothetical protein